MKKSTYTTTRFDIDDDFYVEVSPNGNVIEFMLCNENYCIKSFMFGMDKKDCPEEKWEKLIEYSVERDIEEFYRYNDIIESFEDGFLE